MRWLFLLTIYFSCVACNNGSAKRIRILNNAGSVIDSIRIISYGIDLKIETIKPNQVVEKEYISTYAGNYPGSFAISIYVKDSLVNSGTMGYFKKPSEIPPLQNITINEDFKF